MRHAVGLALHLLRLALGDEGAGGLEQQRRLAQPLPKNSRLDRLVVSLDSLHLTLIVLCRLLEARQLCVQSLQVLGRLPHAVELETAVVLPDDAGMCRVEFCLECIEALVRREDFRQTRLDAQGEIVLAVVEALLEIFNPAHLLEQLETILDRLYRQAEGRVRHVGLAQLPADRPVAALDF